MRFVWRGVPFTLNTGSKNERISESNPKLHKLYVIWAQHDLQLINETLEKFSEVSRVSMSIIAGLIFEERAKLLKEDAAFQEACWRIAASDLLTEDPAE